MSRYSPSVPIPAVPADPASLSPTSVFQARQTCAKIILAQAGSSTADDQTLIVFSNRDIGCGCRSKAMVVNMSSNHDDPTTPKPVLMAETEKHAARIQTPELVAAPLEQAAPPFSILPRVDPVGETFNQSTGGIDYPICAKGQAPMRRDPANPSQVLISYLRPSRPQAAVAAQPQGCSSAIALPYYQVFVDPPVLQVPNLISAEAAVYLKNMPNGDWKASMVGHGVFSHSKDTSTRTLEMEKSANRQSLSHSLERGIRTRDPVVLNIEMRIAQLLAAADPSHGDVVDWLSRIEGLTLLKYDSPTQYYKPHHDGKWRRWSMILYLDTLTAADGGTTHFPHLGIQLGISSGVMYAFRNLFQNPATGSWDADMRLIHEALPPSQGVSKHCLVCFVRSETEQQSQFDREDLTRLIGSWAGGLPSQASR